MIACPRTKLQTTKANIFNLNLSVGMPFQKVFVRCIEYGQEYIAPQQYKGPGGHDGGPWSNAPDLTDITIRGTAGMVVALGLTGERGCLCATWEKSMRWGFLSTTIHS